MSIGFISYRNILSPLTTCLWFPPAVALLFLPVWLKEEVNKIAFELPNGKGKGTCIWEPLSTWEKIFDTDGKSNKLLLIYDELSNKFL